MAIRKRKDGTFVLRYLEGGKGGVYRQETLGRVSHAEAIRIHKARVGAASGRRGKDYRRVIFADLAEWYLKVYAPELSPKWRKDVERIVRARLIPEFGRMEVERLTPFDVDAYRRKRQEESENAGRAVAPATLNREWAVLHVIVRTAISNRLIERDPFPSNSVKVMREPKSRLIYFTPEEWRGFVAAFDDVAAWRAYRKKNRRLGPVISGAGGSPGERRYGGGMLSDSSASDDAFDRIRAALPVFQALLYTGSRRGEILDLRWKDVDLVRGVIRIPQPKTKNAKTIPISETLRELLGVLPRGIGEAHVFTRRSGCAWEPSKLRRAFDVAKTLAKLRDELTIHSLRHTHASWLAIEGVPIRTIQELLGHSSYRTTEKYAHLSPAHLADAVNLIGKIEKGAAEEAAPVEKPDRVTRK